MMRKAWFGHYRNQYLRTFIFFSALHGVTFVVLYLSLVNVRYSYFWNNFKTNWNELMSEHKKMLEQDSKLAFMLSQKEDLKKQTFQQKQHIKQLIEANSNRLQNNLTPFPLPQSKKSFTIGIISIGRKYPYLVSTIVSILKSLDEEERKSCHLFVLNANSNPSNNTAAKLVENIVPVFNLHEIPQNLLSDLNFKANNTFHKEVFDYVVLLRMSYYLQTEYSVLLEDDVKASPHFLKKIIARAIPELRNEKGKWLNMRMFVIDYWENWGVDSFGILMSISVGFSLVLTNFHLLITEQRVWTCCLRRKHDFFIFFMWAMYTMWIFWSIGKQNIFESSPNGLQQWNGIGGSTAVALLYPWDILRELTEYLVLNHAANPKDWIIDDFARKRKLIQFHLVPHLFQPMGAFTSLPNTTMSQTSFVKYYVTNQFDQSGEISD